MSSQYPILDSRPIDQWKVTELKEELKRRKLTTKGLKDDLIRRLNEAIFNERETSEEESEDEVKDEHEEAEFPDTKLVKETQDNVENETGKVDENAAVVDINDTPIELGHGKVIPTELGQGKVQDEKMMDSTDSIGVDGESADIAVTVGTSVTISGTMVTEVISCDCEQEVRNNESQMENEDSKPLHQDAVLDVPDPNNQVSEVSPVLGFQVKSDSISTDSVSINEKNELKDNLNADNVHLELEVVKSEMVQPSSSDVPTNGGDLHPLDDQEPREDQGSVEEIDDNNATDGDLSKKNDSADAGSSEKLNLDRSPGDDYMEEDVLESKQTDSNHNSDEVRDRIELIEVCVVKEQVPVVDAAGDDLSCEKKEIPVEDKSTLAAPAEKRKLQDQEAIGNNEPPKRQRRWNSETLKVPEPRSSNITPSGTPRDMLQTTIPKRNFTRSDSTLSGDAPKERVVPPSPRPPTNSLRIDRFLRPFTLKAVQELLSKTGKVCSFWMDHIKTHCYVTYSSVEEAIETRNAVYNLQWPSNGGRLLMAEFVDPQEVKMRVEAPPQSPISPVSTSPTVPQPPSAFQPQSTPRQHSHKQQQLPPPPPLPIPPPPPISDLPTARERLSDPPTARERLSDPPTARERLSDPPSARERLSDLPSARERLTLPPPPPLPEKMEPPIVTLDDLFRKTKFTPRIYYLPLSEEQVAAKLAARKSTKQ